MIVAFAPTSPLTPNPEHSPFLFPNSVCRTSIVIPCRPATRSVAQAPNGPSWTRDFSLPRAPPAPRHPPEGDPPRPSGHPAGPEDGPPSAVGPPRPAVAGARADQDSPAGAPAAA